MKKWLITVSLFAVLVTANATAATVPKGLSPAVEAGRARSAHVQTVQHHVRSKGKKPADMTKGVKSYPVPEMGVAENMALTTDDATSQRVVALAKGLGYNLLRVNVYFQLSDDHNIWTQAPTDPAALCNAAVNAANAGMTLMITYMPTNSRGYPQTEDQLNEVIGQPTDTSTVKDGDIGAYNKALYDPVSGCANGRGAKPLVRTWQQLGNEMNISTFCSPQSDIDHLLCAQEAAVMQARFYNYVNRVLEPLYVVSIPVIAASVGSHHTPFDFWTAYAHKVAVLTQCTPCADIIDYHPYPLWGSSDQRSGFTNFGKMVAACRLAYGPACGTVRLPICFCEWAAQTVIPPSKAGLYRNQEPWSSLVVPEPLQGPITQTFVNYCRVLHVIGCVVFHVVDEPDLLTGFQSGTYYPDFTPKSSLAAVSQAVQSAYKPLSIVKNGPTGPGAPPQ